MDFLKHVIASSLSFINFFVVPKLLYASEKLGFNSIALLNEKIASYISQVHNQMEWHSHKLFD